MFSMGSIKLFPDYKHALHIFVIQMETVLLIWVIVIQAPHVFSEQVKIFGPRYIQRNKPLHLNCSSTIVPYEQIAEFLANDKSHKDIYMKDGKCYKGNAECFDGECVCYDGGRSYYLQYQVAQHTKAVKITCRMRFESGHVIIEDSINIQIVDVDGPFITSMAGSSMIAGTKTRLVCTVNTTLIGYDLTLNCLNKAVRHVSCSSCFASMEIYLSSEMTGNFCSCSFKWEDLIIYEKLVFNIKKTPSISLDNTTMCFSQKPVVLTCRLSGELSSFGFIDWSHNVRGKFIRYIKSNQTGNTAKLTITSCTYMDIGDYRCAAYNNYGNEKIWANRTSTVTMIGPPVVVHSYIVQGVDTILITFCYSVSIINETKWYFFEELLENTSGNIQVMTEEIVQLPMYNEIAEIPVHRINITIKKAKSGVYRVVITNRHGETKHQFQLKKDMDGFNLSVIIVGLIAVAIFLVTLVVSTIVLLGCLTKCTSIIQNAQVIYHAAPYFESEVRSYDITDPTYDDCDVSLSGSVHRRINQNVDVQQPNSQTSRIYEEVI